MQLLVSTYGNASDHLSAAQQAMTVDERNKVYAPRDPADLQKLRKEVGLIGPGSNTPLPSAKFPGYLRTPETVEELIPQARYAVQQKGGRSPLGLTNPGDVVLIPVPHTADPMVQEAITRAYALRNVEARIIYEHELAGVEVPNGPRAQVGPEDREVHRRRRGQQDAHPRLPQAVRRP